VPAKKVAGGWRKLPDEELHYLYSSPDISRLIKLRQMMWVGHIACIRKMINVYKILFGKREGKRPCGRPRYRWKDNLRKDHREIGWEGVD
jgi:hypothetical protein